VAAGHDRYRFGPLERRGLIAGWRGGQIAAAAAGLAVAVLVLRGRASVAGILVATVAVGASVALAWWPIGGRTGEEWLPTVVRWGASGVSGGRRHQAPAPSVGHCVGADGRPCLVPSTVADAKGHPTNGLSARDGRHARVIESGNRTFTHLHVLEAREPGSREAVGVVLDARARTYTASMELLGHSFALLGADEKARRVSAWAAVLTSLARERAVVHRLQWLVATIPDDGAAVGGYLSDRAVLPAEATARRSYADLLHVAGADTCRHEVLLSVQVRAAGTAGRAVRSAGGGHRGACAVLLRELASLRRQLSGADVPVERILDPPALAAVVRRSAEPRPGGGRGCPPCGTGWPWPVAVETRWACLRTDGTWHATYWIAEWPRVDVGPEFLGPLLLGSARRSVAVVMEPMSPFRAVRQAERARTADIADAELRRRGGFLSTARRGREAELATRREEELADGHAAFRFTGYVTVTAVTRDQLEEACEATEQAASQCRLELRRLYGDQERAFTCTLPLARGLA
jgi:hypothetical protein